MSDKTEKDPATHLSAYQTRPVLSIVNEVRLGQRVACTFVGDGEGNLKEISTGMVIYPSKEAKESSDSNRKKAVAP